MGLDPMLQQRSVAQVFVALTEDVKILLKELVELLLLKRERFSGRGGWHGEEKGFEVEGGAGAGASASWTTSRTPMLCPAWS